MPAETVSAVSRSSGHRAARWLGVALLPFCALGTLRGEVVTDGSLGPAGALSGPAFQIPASLGRKVDSNLFHSFSQFNLATGESATFSGPADVRNVFSRVTGGSASTIDGLLRSTIPGANFYLLNPHGVMFGANASVDVDGSFAVSTGDHLALSDGTNFNAAPGPGDAQLTSSPPAAFGFLPANAGPISVQGSTLAGAAGATWSLIGGDVQMKDATLAASSVVIRGGRLVMENAKITTTVLQPLDRVDVKLRQSLALTAGSAIEATALGPTGTDPVIDVAAPDVAISGASALTSIGAGATRAGNVRIRGANVALTTGGRVDANSFGAGAGGDIEVEARDVSIRGLGAGLGSQAADAGPGGNVRLNLTGQLTFSAGGTIQTSTFGPAPSGNISVAAANLSATGGSSFDTGIIANTLATGAAGNVTLTLSGKLEVAAGAKISSDTFGPGPGGDVTVTAQSAAILGRGLPAFTAISTETQGTVKGGRGGNIQLNIDGRLIVTGGGQITATSFGSGAGGNVDITAGSVSISGAGAVFFPGISARTLNPTNGGRGGDVRMNVGGLLDLVAGGKIAVSTAGSGAGGSAVIEAQSISVSGRDSQITAATSSGIAGGAGGNLAIRTGLLLVSDLGEISASTTGTGAGGSLDIAALRVRLDGGRITADTNAPATVDLPVKVSDLTVTLDIDHSHDENLNVALFGPDGTFVELFSGVGGSGENFRNTVLSDRAPDSIATGAAPFTGTFQPLSPLAAYDGIAFNGQWFLAIANTNLTDIVALKSWSLTVGNITVTSPDVPKTIPGPDNSNNNLSVLTVNVPPASTVPIKAGRGGDVTITANELSLLGGARISARTLDASPGGNVNLKVAGQLEIANTGIVTASTLAAGRGGSVRVEAGHLLVSDGGLLSAGTSGIGAGGDVQVRAGSVVISAGASGRPTLISAESTATGRGGRGGDLRIDTGSLRISGREGVETGVSARSSGLGSSGSITLKVRTLSLDTSATIGSSNTGPGTAGSVSIRADGGIALDGRSLITTSAAQGDAGTIAVASETRIDLRGQSSITASAGSNGGSIQITAREALTLTDSSITATAGSVQLASGTGGGTGGNIFVDPIYLILDHSLISANAAIGQGGNILLVAENFLPSETAITATGSTAGTVQITAPELDLSGALTPLATQLVDATARLQERCAMRLGVATSSFLVLGRGSVATAPDEPQMGLSRRLRPLATKRSR